MRKWIIKQPGQEAGQELKTVEQVEQKVDLLLSTVSDLCATLVSENIITEKQIPLDIEKAVSDELQAREREENKDDPEEEKPIGKN